MKKTKDTSPKWVWCEKCHSKLCQRIPAHNGDDEIYILYIKHRQLKIWAHAIVLECYNCGSCYRISGQKGIEAKEHNKYALPR